MILSFIDFHTILMISYLSTLLDMCYDQKWNQEEDKVSVNDGHSRMFFLLPQHLRDPPFIISSLFLGSKRTWIYPSSFLSPVTNQLCSNILPFLLKIFNLSSVSLFGFF